MFLIAAPTVLRLGVGRCPKHAPANADPPPRTPVVASVPPPGGSRGNVETPTPADDVDDDRSHSSPPGGGHSDYELLGGTVICGIENRVCQGGLTPGHWVNPVPTPK